MNQKDIHSFRIYVAISLPESPFWPQSRQYFEGFAAIASGYGRVRGPQRVVKVRVKLRFKGRQKAHKEFSFEVVNKFVRDLAAYGHADSPPKMLGDRDLNVVITPPHGDKRGKNPGLAAPPPSAPPAGDSSPA